MTPTHRERLKSIQQGTAELIRLAAGRPEPELLKALDASELDYLDEAIDTLLEAAEEAWGPSSPAAGA